MKQVWLVLSLLLAIASQSAADEPISLAAKDAMRAIQRGDQSGGLAALEALARGGDASGHQALGEIYFGGLGGVLTNYEKACHHFRQAAPRINAAVHSLAGCYFQGRGVPQDRPRARELYQQGIDRGFTKSMCGLGNMLIKGQGGATDISRGLELCKRAAEAGDADAQTDYGNYFLMGEVLPRDVVAARHWYELAAGQDHANAAFTLGQIFWNGDGVVKNNAEAARYWRIAYGGGRREAAFLLGNEAMVRTIARNGVTSSVNLSALNEATTWLQKAVQEDPDESVRVQAADRIHLLEDLKAKIPNP